jgi:hypothetical protein
VKENMPGTVNVSAFASAAEAKIARADAPASKSALVDLIMLQPPVLLSGSSAKPSGTSQCMIVTIN